MMAPACNPSTRRLRQEDQEFKTEREREREREREGESWKSKRHIPGG
jgi:hypothetical protein